MTKDEFYIDVLQRYYAVTNKVKKMVKPEYWNLGDIYVLEQNVFCLLAALTIMGLERQYPRPDLLWGFMQVYKHCVKKDFSGMLFKTFKANAMYGHFAPE